MMAIKIEKYDVYTDQWIVSEHEFRTVRAAEKFLATNILPNADLATTSFRIVQTKIHRDEPKQRFKMEAWYPSMQRWYGLPVLVDRLTTIAEVARRQANIGTTVRFSSPGNSETVVHFERQREYFL